jgi:NDP-sugar pyrophosphorylase family protein
VVTDHFGDGSRWGVRITYSRETEILGTAGAVKHVAWFFDGPFFVWYGDNLCTCRLDRLWEFHRARGGIATIALHQHEDPTKAGIVALGEDQRILRFLEKPKPDEVFSTWANGGIYVLEPEVLEAIPAGRAADFGRDVFPALLADGAAMYGYRLSGDERFWYVDRPEDLQRTADHWRARG